MVVIVPRYRSIARVNVIICPPVLFSYDTTDILRKPRKCYLPGGNRIKKQADAPVHKGVETTRYLSVKKRIKITLWVLGITSFYYLDLISYGGII
ncbi:hypothetical protein [Propionigenium maris]|uniref:hypothetical protein n=1 Tax=Propionigenium maris TaxID=45622 RepID=UPI002491C1C7|nr:hypothetical protein [Propionigenium maris]